MSPDISVAALAVTAAALAALAGVAAAWLSRMRDRVIVDRTIDRVAGDKTSTTSESAELLDRANRRKSSDVMNDVIMRFLPTLSRTRQRMHQAGLKVDVSAHVFLVLILTALTVQLADLPDFLPAWGWPLAIAFGIHFVIDTIILAKLVERRKKMIVQQIEKAVEFMVRGIQVGQSVEEAIQEASDVVGDPLRTSLITIVRLNEVGVTLPTALNAVANDLDVPEFDFLVSAILAQRDTGGNLSDALSNLVDVIRGRNQLEQKVKALTAEGKSSAGILGSMPFLLFGYLWSANPGYVSPLFERDAGQVVLYLSFGLVLLGVVTMAKMIRIEV